MTVRLLHRRAFAPARVANRGRGEGSQRQQARAAGTPLASAVAWTLAAILAAEVLALLLPESAQPFHRVGFLLVLAAVVAAGWRAGMLAAVVSGLVGGVGILHIFFAYGEQLGPVPVRLVVGATVSAFGLALGALIGHLRDRERRAVEALVQEREAAAAAEGRTFGIGRLFHAVGEAVVVSDATGRVRMWNPAAERIFGYARDEALGSDISMIVPDALKAQHHAGMQRFRETGHGSYIDSHKVLTLPAVRKDGRLIVVELTLSRVDQLVTEEGEGPYAVAIMRDVTERVELTKDLQTSNAALESTNRALRDANETLEAFTYVASHDLKEPVRALESYSRALEEDHGAMLDADPDARDLVVRMRDNASRLRRLIEGLLDYSRASRIAPHELEPARVEDALASSDCRTRFEHLVAERGARLVVEPGPPVHASMAGLCQVLGNVVLNAVKHKNDGPSVVRVRSRRLDDDPRLVEIVVEDDGPGFPDAVLQAFGRVKGGRPSTIRGGFGLIITRQAVEKMGGAMWLENRPQGGGVVHFTLPAARDGPE